MAFGEAQLEAVVEDGVVAQVTAYRAPGRITSEQGLQDALYELKSWGGYDVVGMAESPAPPSGLEWQ